MPRWSAPSPDRPLAQALTSKTSLARKRFLELLQKHCLGLHVLAQKLGCRLLMNRGPLWLIQPTQHR